MRQGLWIDGPPWAHEIAFFETEFAVKRGRADWLGFCTGGGVLPFSKRTPPPEEYRLQSGDFEAVKPQSRSYGHENLQVPPAPRAPVFARQAAPMPQSSPYGFGQSQPYYQQQQQQQHQPQPYGHYEDLSAPPPPHSLAPVAMGSERMHSSSVSVTGSQRAQTVVIRQKPSLKLGVMIALTGALLGGVLGLGMDAKRQQARAAAAANEAHDSVLVPVPAMVAAALPTEAAVNSLAGHVTTATAIAPAPVAVAAPAPVVLAPSAPIAVTTAKVEPPAKPARHAAAVKPAPVKHPTFVAAKVTAPKPPPPEKEPPPAAPAKPTKPEKIEKPEPVKSAPSDARKVLEDAIKDTTNTL